MSEAIKQPGHFMASRRRERRAGWMAVAFALLVNLLLFFAMAWTNTPARRRPSTTDLVVREIFQAAPPPQPPPPEEEAPPPATEVAAHPVEIAEAPPSPVRFDPRIDLPEMPLDLPAPRVALPLPRFESGPLAAESADRPPRRTSTALPPYPPWARLRKLEAVVTLTLVVDAQGAVQKVDVVSVEGDERFGEVAREAVRSWTYEPAVLNGRRVPVTLTQRVRFQLLD